MQTHLEKLKHAFEELEAVAGKEFHQLFHKMEYKKGAFLLKQGNVCRYTWLIESGLARVFSIKKDIEIVTYFAFPGTFIDSCKSYVLQVPSKESIQLIEDSVVYQIRKKDIEHLASKYTQVNQIDKLMTELYAIWLEDRIYSLQFSTTKERYDELMHSYPQYIQKIPLTYLASYLGVTLETLSRIRAMK